MQHERRSSHERMTIRDVIRNLEHHKRDYPKDAAWADERIAWWRTQKEDRRDNGQFKEGG
jgi:hypothetical protein